MALALFDLDNTLLNGDSDHSWGLFLANVGAVDPLEQTQKQDYFYQKYVNGELNILEFCEFQFRPLTQYPLAQLHEWRLEFMQTIIEPMIIDGKPDLVEKHRAAGDELVIITATSDFVTQPIAERLNVPTLIATQAEQSNGVYTGKVTGTPCFQGGKVTRLLEWLDDKDRSLQNSVFYSDSINDLPLLERVDKAVAVTPDKRLRAHAEEFHWEIID